MKESFRKGIQQGIQTIRDLFSKGLFGEEQAKKAEEALLEKQKNNTK